jgi:DNA-binding PadR family transcriptional regulator
MSKPLRDDVGRVAGVGYLILASLADGEKHGYRLTQDIEEFAGVRIAPGSLYEALARLEGQGWIEPVASADRRRPYRLTAAGASVLDQHLRSQERLVAEGRRRLRRSWRFA